MESSFFYYLCLKYSLLGVYKKHTTLDVIDVVIFKANSSCFKNATVSYYLITYFDPCS